ncbi:MAG: FRG domain-containing protein [Chloroflexota bacterium]
MLSNEKPWSEVTISSWNWFDKQLDKHRPREWLFRGHSKSSWELRTSLDRLFDDAQKIIRDATGKDRKFAKKVHEELLIKSFQKNANLYLKFLPDYAKPLEWLAIMQHYGTPTRLLDVTLSPHTATFFALEEGIDDCCVFAFNHAEIKRVNKTILKKDTYKDVQDEIFQSEDRFITVFNPEYGNERLVPQKGLFLVPSQVEESFENLLADYLEFVDDAICIKYVIPAQLRYRGLERLQKMNITAATLFPGIDGFCRSLKYQVLETTQSQKLLE